MNPGIAIDDIENALLSLPHEIAQLESTANLARVCVDERKSAVELAETNAALMSDASGKDAETRKLQRAQAVESDAEVIATRADLNQAKLNLADAETAVETQRRMFAAYLKIAELRAAQLYQMSAREQVKG